MVEAVEVRPWAWPAETGVSPPPPGTSTTTPGWGRQLLGSFRPLFGPLDPVAAAVGTLDAPVATADGETGAVGRVQHTEARLARLCRSGTELVWGDAEPVPSLHAWEVVNRERGRASVQVVRSEPELLAYTQLGSWFNAGWRARGTRRAGLATRARRHGRARGDGRARQASTLWRLRGDVAFWSGVREAATAQEWRRWTQCSYVVLMYHRLAGAGVAGQQQMDLSPRRFDAHMRLLRMLRYRPLDVEEILRFHSDPGALLPRRAYLVTLDDAYEDNAVPLLSHVAHRPVVFAPTAMVGARATFADGEPILTWEQLQALEDAGVGVGSHGRRHVPLDTAEVAVLVDELAGSRCDLAAHLRAPVDAVAYPHGRHGAATVQRAAAAGYGAGFTSLPGRNGAGTHPLCLRRGGVWRGDRSAFALWKLWTGEYVPGQARSAGRGALTLVRRARRRDRVDDDAPADAPTTAPGSGRAPSLSP
jgi:peptidoglycan/xylan/chitin deacetylase (PgdA/CDA1 family)